ncbi:hypothetical protein GCM10020229_37070 [Kitasatospora albolonga]
MWISLPLLPVWTRFPATYTRPLKPGVWMVVVPVLLALIREPWNWAPPMMVVVAAFGKFHSRFGRSSVNGSPSSPVPVLVLITGLVPSMLMMTVAPAGMPVMTKSAALVVEPRLPGTLKICRALVPSPVKVTWFPLVVTVPVAVWVEAQVESPASWSGMPEYWSPAVASWIAWPVGTTLTVPLSVLP